MLSFTKPLDGEVMHKEVTIPLHDICNVSFVYFDIRDSSN